MYRDNRDLGIVFYFFGAALILPFAGLEITILFIAFYLSFKWSSKREKIYISQEIVKIEFDEIIVRICQDKKITKAVEEISKYRFSSRDEALNILSSHGWMVDQVWTTEGRNGVTVNYILSKQVPALTPISPWLEKRAEKDGAGKDAGKASGGKRK